MLLILSCKYGILPLLTNVATSMPRPDMFRPRPGAPHVSDYYGKPVHPGSAYEGYPRLCLVVEVAYGLYPGLWPMPSLQYVELI